MAEVLFVVMPFAGLEQPQLGVALLKAQLRARGIPATVAYLNISFAEAAGYTAYKGISQNFGYFGRAGDWLFSRALFKSGDDSAYIEGFLRAKGLCDDRNMAELHRIAAMVEPFLQHCLQLIDWKRFSTIGFTSISENLACLALAKRVKQAFPEKIIVMGGASCAGVMGVQLHKSFDFLDIVFTGAADFSFPELVDRLGSGDARRGDIPGHVHRHGTESVVVSPAANHVRMDALPYPDFDDYFAAYRTSPLRHWFAPVLQMETSRGCWWGEKNHCRFCGCSDAVLRFSVKSPERFLDELIHLVTRYGVMHVAFTDNILSLDYFRTFLPELKRRRLGVKLSSTTKANLRKGQVRLLRDAGVALITPGIESLSRHVLKLMNKGVSPLQNIQLLKWCKEFGVHPFWYFLFGVPGERQEDYIEATKLAETISHFTPPIASHHISLDRFSPFFERAADFGIRNVQAHSVYRHIYQLDENALDNLAYNFEFDFDGKDKIDEWSRDLRALVKQWTVAHAYSRLQVVARTPDAIIVEDTRPVRQVPIYRFSGLEPAVIEFCDRAQSFTHIIQHLSATAGDGAPEESWLRAFLARMIRCRLFIEQEGRYLSLILPQPQAERWVACA